MIKFAFSFFMSALFICCGIFIIWLFVVMGRAALIETQIFLDEISASRHSHQKVKVGAKKDRRTAKKKKEVDE